MYGVGKKGESDKDIILELGHMPSSTVAPMSIRTSSTTPPTPSFLNALVPCTVKHIVFSAVVVIVSFACFFWIAGDNSLTQPKFPTPAASDDDSAAKDEMSSAPVFKGERIRTLPLNSDVLILNTKLPTFTWTDAATTELQPVCASWGVVVTVQAPKKSLAKALEQKGLCLVVVADKQTPLEDYIALTKANTPEHFLKVITVEDQFNLLSNGLEIMNELPWNHFGRKNVGYLYAIAQGATVVFDFQEDIEFISSLPVYSSSSKWSMVNVKAPVVNPYSAFTSFQTVKDVPWPRGFPLTQINNKSTWSSSKLGPPVAVPLQNIGVVQSLIAVNYDMDAIWRMTKQGNPINVKQGTNKTYDRWLQVWCFVCFSSLNLLFCFDVVVLMCCGECRCFNFVNTGYNGQLQQSRYFALCVVGFDAACFRAWSCE